MIYTAAWRRIDEEYFFDEDMVTFIKALTETDPEKRAAKLSNY